MPKTPAKNTVVIDGQRWQLVFRSLRRRNRCGLCEYDKRRVSICTSLEGMERLDTICHELLHACQGFASEEHVAQTATVLATALWRLGYRMEDD